MDRHEGTTLTVPQASAAGLLLGFLVAVAFMLMSRRGVGQHTVVAAATAEAPAPRLTRQARAAQLLEQLSTSATATKSTRASTAEDAGATTASEAAPPVERSGEGDEGENQWETEGDDSDEEDEEDIPDSEVSEYDRMEALRLKMVFVVMQFTPKMAANTVAELTAGAGVGLVEWLNTLSQWKGPSGGDGVPRDLAIEWQSHGCLASPQESERDQWMTWYAWWNRIGCAKIALKCSDADTMDGVVAAAVAGRLPVYVMKTSHVSKAASAAPATAGASGKKSKTKQPESLLSGRAETDAADSLVVVALGPAPADTLDPITGKLKLFT